MSLPKFMPVTAITIYMGTSFQTAITIYMGTSFQSQLKYQSHAKLAGNFFPFPASHVAKLWVTINLGMYNSLTESTPQKSISFNLL